MVSQRTERFDDMGLKVTKTMEVGQGVFGRTNEIIIKSGPNGGKILAISQYTEGFTDPVTAAVTLSRDEVNTLKEEL